MNWIKKYKKIILAVLIIDILIIILHLIWGRQSVFFDLDSERNLPTVYSGLKLIAVGALSFIVYFIISDKKSWLWYILGLMFVYAGLDEMLELHERAADYVAQQELINLGWYDNQVFYWPLIFAPLIIGFLIFLVYFIKYFFPRAAVSRNLFIGGLVCFVAVIFFEVTGGFLTHLPDVYFAMITLEESFEFFAVTMFLSGILYYINSPFFRKKETNLLNF